MDVIIDFYVRRRSAHIRGPLTEAVAEPSFSVFGVVNPSARDVDMVHRSDLDQDRFGNSPTK